MFVKFKEETGEIIGIGPRPDINHNCLEVNLADVLPIIEGKESRKNYRVQFDSKSNNLKLVNVTEYSFNSSNVNDFLYEIPENLDDDADIVVEQNIPETCWKIKLGKNLKKNMKAKGIKLNTTMAFSVTAKHDPNILYKTLFVDFSKVLFDNYCVLDFTMPFEQKNTPLSVFTMRKFDSYDFQRILNED
jgi:hypothetical protein